jgi:hypothetical protein
METILTPEIILHSFSCHILLLRRCCEIVNREMGAKDLLTFGRTTYSVNKENTTFHTQ